MSWESIALAELTVDLATIENRQPATRPAVDHSVTGERGRVVSDGDA